MATRLLPVRRLSGIGCYFFIFQLVAQAFVIIFIAATIQKTGRLSTDYSGWIPKFLSSPLVLDSTGDYPGSALANAVAAVRQQLRFVQNERSWLSVVYHDEVTPTLKPPQAIINNTVPLAEFCNERRKGDDRKTDARHAVFRNAILVARQLLLPSTIDCNTIPPRLAFHTMYHDGLNSTPALEARVVLNTDSFLDFESAYSCHERVYEPSVLFSFINWPQHGHAIFNAISLLWDAFRHPETGPLSLAGKNVRLYAYGDALNGDRRQEWQQNAPFLHMEHLDKLMTLFSHQPVRSLASLLMQSERHPICFTYLLVGLSGELDHYNFNSSLDMWREFARAVRKHFGVLDTPKLSQHARAFERVIPEDLGGRWSSDDTLALGDIKPIDWGNEILKDRPRLVIIDRHDNRRLLNAKELLRIAKSESDFLSADIVYLEDLELEDQIRLMGETDMLFGMDGTGLMNGVFMPEGSIVVHVRPYGCAEFLTSKGENFDRLFSANPGRVLRYESGDRNSTVLPVGLPEREELVFNHNSTVGYRVSFILKQDTTVDPAVFRCILNTGVKLLYGLSVDWTQHKLCLKSEFV